MILFRLDFVHLQLASFRMVEEENGHEKLRPQWKQLMASLKREDELVVSKFSNALRGSRPHHPPKTE